jgi:hypothetical protein
MSKLKIGGRFVVEIWRKERMIKRLLFHNGVTTEGLNDLLSVGFRGGGQHTDWYFGLIDGTVAPTLSPADTMSSHAGWSENTNYDESARQDWNPVQSSDKYIVNTTYPSFTMNASVTIAGAFITSSSTKGGTGGTLWSTGLFANGNAALESSDILKTYYELTAASS